MRKILVRQSGNVAMMEGPGSLKGFQLTITLPSGGFDKIVEEFSADQLLPSEWQLLKKNKKRKVNDLKSLEKKLKLLYKRGNNPDEDKRRDEVDRKFKFQE